MKEREGGREVKEREGGGNKGFTSHRVIVRHIAS